MKNFKELQDTMSDAEQITGNIRHLQQHLQDADVKLVELCAAEHLFYLLTVNKSKLKTLLNWEKQQQVDLITKEVR